MTFTESAEGEGEELSSPSSFNPLGLVTSFSDRATVQLWLKAQEVEAFSCLWSRRRTKLSRLCVLSPAPTLTPTPPSLKKKKNNNKKKNKKKEKNKKSRKRDKEQVHVVQASILQYKINHAVFVVKLLQVFRKIAKRVLFFFVWAFFVFWFD